MTPLEAVAKARWEYVNLPYGGVWDELLPREQREQVDAVRVVLLALAEVERLPLDWIAGDDAQATRITEDFRAICRAIAKEGTEG